MEGVERFYVLGPPLVSALMLTAVFAYLWWESGRRYLGVWMLGSGLFVLRYAYGFLGSGYAYLPGEAVLPVLAVARGTALLWGAHEMAGRGWPRWWGGLVGLDLAWLALEVGFGLDWTPFGARGLTHYAIFAGGLVWAGAILLRSGALPGGGRVLAGTALLVLGAIQISFPWSATLPEWYRRAAFLVSHGAQILVGVGVLIAFFAQAQREAHVLGEHLADALTRALEGFLPICAHCHAIREAEGRWKVPEAYVSDRTGARFSHTVCPPAWTSTTPA